MSDFRKIVEAVLVASLLWFLAFGATVGGRHYELSCSFDRGVEWKR